MRLRPSPCFQVLILFASTIAISWHSSAFNAAIDSVKTESSFGSGSEQAHLLAEAAADEYRRFRLYNNGITDPLHSDLQAIYISAIRQIPALQFQHLRIAEYVQVVASSSATSITESAVVLLRIESQQHSKNFWAADVLIDTKTRKVQSWKLNQGNSPHGILGGAEYKIKLSSTPNKKGIWRRIYPGGW